MFRGILDNVLSGMKAGFKAILNLFKHPNGESRMFNLKSSSKLSATLLALILGASVFMAGQVWAAKYVTDPTTGKVVTAPEYGGTLTMSMKSDPAGSDSWFGHPTMKLNEQVGEMLGYLNWAVDRNEIDLTAF